VALDLARRWGGTMPLRRLLEPAIAYARGGVAVTRGQSRLTDEKAAECRDQPGFAAAFMAHGSAPAIGGVLRQEALARTLDWLAQAGCEDFYRGDLARMIAADLARAGSPITADDLARMRAVELAPLSIDLAGARAFNLPPPTQGFASLIILALAERFGVDWRDEAASIHALVEASKLALRTRDAELRDPASMRVEADALITPAAIDALARAFDPARAAPWPAPVDKGDTVWMGAIDLAGRAVSFIQSLYWEFGSAVVLRDCGFVWQNRGTSFPLDPGHPNRLAPGRLPFHTLNPALARLADGRVVVYGTMGGDGQPQTQAAILTRLRAGMEPQQAVSAPRWLLGRTWGTTVTKLRVEARVSPAAIDRLRALGHDLEVIEPYSELVGHAGMIVRRPDGVLEGAADPRGDGLVAAI
jgi:gamma-glutamyltranspeptidase/glutathione hydrolase